MTVSNENLTTNFIFNKMFGEYAFENENLSIRMYRSEFVITDLTNAQKRGKFCLSISFHCGNNGAAKFANWMSNEYKGTIVELFREVAALDSGNKYGTSVDYEKYPCFKSIYIERVKGVNVASPFAIKTIKALKSAPKKWTITNAIQALVNGQTKDGLRCNFRLSDDHLFDASNGLGRGVFSEEDTKEFVNELIATKSRWKVYGGEGNSVRLSRQGESYSFVFETK